MCNIIGFKFCKDGTRSETVSTASQQALMFENFARIVRMEGAASSAEKFFWAEVCKHFEIIISCDLFFQLAFAVTIQVSLITQVCMDACLQSMKADGITIPIQSISIT